MITARTAANWRGSKGDWSNFAETQLRSANWMPLPNTAAAAGFQNPEAYEKAMGRWSRRLAPPLIQFGGLADGDRVLDVGCGTGSLTFALPQIANIASATGIDLTEAYLEFARAQNSDPRITFRTADARALPFEDNSFDRAFSMLVLQFIPDAARAVAEMRRVVQPGGTTTAAVWDVYGGMPTARMMWDIAAALDPSIEPPLFQPLSQPNEMATLWRELGFVDVEQTSLLIRMEFSCFDDYWLPLTSEGPVAQFVAGLSAAARATLTEYVRRAYVANLPDGPRSFACVA
jgi:SAM-dependent methyltransferase